MSVAVSQLGQGRDHLTILISRPLAVLISIGGRSRGKGEHTPILTIMVIPSDWPLRQKSGEHVNIHITDGLDEVISMNFI